MVKSKPAKKGVMASYVEGAPANPKLPAKSLTPKAKMAKKKKK